MMTVDIALKLKQFLKDTYQLEIGEIASKQIIDYLYPLIEANIYEKVEHQIKQETIQHLVEQLESNL